MSEKYFKLDLGIPHLLSDWKQLFSKRYLVNDLQAGITVACVAIPLSLAIALASGVSPATGLVSAIIGGIICALFGGTPLAVSGPAAAMSILIANSVEKFGFKGIVFICLIIGLMQLLSGITRLGRLSRFVPVPVVAAFTAGIGVIIIIGQLPRALGLPQSDHSHILQTLSHLAFYIGHIKPAPLILVIMTIACIRILPKYSTKIPAALFAVIITTLFVHFFSINYVPVIGDIPRTLPMPKLPLMPSADIGQLFLTSFTIYLLACLETLLSASAVDKLVKHTKHDANQELIGQGLGNIVTALFSGIPITGVIARSAVNVRSGAKTRRASIIHSIVILCAVFFGAPLIAKIPVATLAGVLLSVAASMINVQEFRALLRTSRSEAMIYGVTFLMMIFVDLTAGIQVGILAAGLMVLIRASRARLHITQDHHDAIRLSFVGPVTFLSSNKITELEKELHNLTPEKPIILDFSKLRDLDMSGASAIIDFVQNFQRRKFNVFIKGLPSRFESIFHMCDGSQMLEDTYIVAESELKMRGTAPLKSFHGRLLHGVQKFHAARENKDKRLVQHLAKQQDPHTLFITCSDSRILTSTITQSDAGELFVIRNVGNYVPPYNPNLNHGECAAVEFALGMLDVREIVVCGHSGCGAIQACCNDPNNDPRYAQLEAWISHIRSGLNCEEKDIAVLAQQNILNQMKHLEQYPIVKERLANKDLHIHGWYIDLEHYLIYEWSPAQQVFKPIGGGALMDDLVSPGGDEEIDYTYN